MGLFQWYLRGFRRRVHMPGVVGVFTLALCVAGLSSANTVSPGQTADVARYVLWYRNFDSPAVYALIKLALDETPEYGPYEIVRSADMGQGRAVLELSHGNSRLIDIANVATSRQREVELLAIPIPIDGGLLGFRVCVIERENLPLFANIHSLRDLVDRGISIGQGKHWPDTPILRANGVNVITSTRFETLFRMLKGNRFDCFARGVNEVLFDLKDQSADGLIIEPSLLLAYPMPSYFFVAPNDLETAQRLQLGMARAIQDGRFRRFSTQLSK